MVPVRPLYSRDRVSPHGPAGIWDRNFLEVLTMQPIVWGVWILCAVFLAVMHLYRSRLTRDEEDQIFLDDAANHQKKEQEDILVKVNKIQPFIRVVTGVTCALTVGIIGVYVWDALQHLM